MSVDGYLLHARERERERQIMCSWRSACVRHRERRGRRKWIERMNRATAKSFLLCGLDPPPSPALLISKKKKTTTSHPSLVFSFRPSWSSSTPAYGTLLPWGRTMRRPSPVSPLFSHLFSLCFFFFPAAGLGTRPSRPPDSLHLSLFLSPRPCIDLSTYLSFMS